MTLVKRHGLARPTCGNKWRTLAYNINTDANCNEPARIKQLRPRANKKGFDSDHVVARVRSSI